MRILALLALFLLQAASRPTTSQPNQIEGDWLGTLNVGAVKLRLVFHIARVPGGALGGTMDSIDQGAKGIPLTRVSAGENGTVEFECKSIGGVFAGKPTADGKALDGKFTQMGQVLPLSLARTQSIPTLARPQEPKPPLPYAVEELTFEDRPAGVTLGATLTRPNGPGPFPAVVLISGSGPNNRNEEILGHKPFLIIADALTRRGVAVLRYDKRGVGKSTGSYEAATSQDFAADARAAVAFLKSRPDIDPKRIGLLGHSEGGLIAPMVAAKSPDVAFVVLLAAPGVSGAKLLPAQQEAILKAAGADAATLGSAKDLMANIIRVVHAGGDLAQMERQISDLQKASIANLPEATREVAAANMKAMSQFITSPWFRQFMDQDPAPDLAAMKCPVLALNGEKDLQVLVDQNLPAVEAAIRSGGNKDVTATRLPGLNHLFQPCTTGSPAEYAMIETTISPDVLRLIGDWVTQHTRAK